MESTQVIVSEQGATEIILAVPGVQGAVGNVSAHESAADPHPQYLTPAEGDAAYATAAQGTLASTAIQPGNAALTNARTPTAHKSTHATGGSDALTPADIGAATAAQGSLAATAVQPGSLATVATSGAYNDLSGRPTLGTAAAAGTGDFATAAQGTDAREWTAATIEQAEAEAGTATTRRAFTAQRVFQAIAAWWGGSAAASKLDGIEAGAQVNVGTNLTYDPASREVRSSTGDDVALPLVSTSAAGLAPATGAPSGRFFRDDGEYAHPQDVIVIPVGDESTALTTGANKIRFRMPFAATLLAVRANVNAAPTGSTLIVDINEAGTTLLSTKLSIDASETTSTTAAVAAVISDSSLADDAEISIDIDQIGSTVAGAGLKVSLFVRRV
jgi:hypothetical protein